MDVQTLRRELAELAFGYFMSGELSEDWLGEQLAPDWLPVRFHEYSRLVDLHLALDPSIIQFVDGLSKNLRQIKTETRREQHQGRDAIEGHINWQSTYQARHNKAPGDRSLFVTERRTEAFDIPENLVLKKLLSVVHETTTDLNKANAKWVSRCWGEVADTSLDEFNRLYSSNVYLGRIPTPGPTAPPERMIQRTKSARRMFYRDTAELLEWRRALLAGNQTALRTLFESGVIQPNEDTLFELFAVLSVLRGLDARFGERVPVRPLEGGGEALAQIGEPPVYLYHNSAAIDQGLRFPSLPVWADDNHEYQNERTSNEWLARSQAVSVWSEKIQTQIWGEEADHTGRPDCILFQPAAPEDERFVESILVVEVKNSTSKETISSGISETLRYLAYASKTAGDTEFLFPDTDVENAFGRQVNGLLVIQDLGDERELPIAIDGPISIVEVSDLSADLPLILENAFNPGD